MTRTERWEMPPAADLCKNWEVTGDADNLNRHTHHWGYPQPQAELLLAPLCTPGSWSSPQRRVDFPSCRPVLLQEKKRNDDEVRLWEACSEHVGLLSNYNILVLLLVALSFIDNKNAERDGCFPGSYPSPDWQRAFASELSGVVCRALSRFPHLPFALSTSFRRLCPEESIVPCVSLKYII